MPKKSFVDRVTSKVEDDYRDPELEMQYVSWVTRVSPEHVLNVRAHWFTDSILAQIVETLSEHRTVMTDTLLYRELKRRFQFGKDEAEMYKDTIRDVFEYEANLNSKSAMIVADELRMLYESRAIFEASAEFLSNIDDFDIEQAKARLKELGIGESVDDAQHFGSYTGTYAQRVEEAERRRQASENQEGGHAGIPTGIEVFDNMTGGLIPPEFGIILGRSGIGKTITLVNFAASAWEFGEDVVIYSGEMSKLALDYRLDAYFSGVDAKKFRVGGLEEKDYRLWDSTIHKLTSERDNVLYTVSAKRSFTRDDVDAAISRIEEETGRRIRLCLIDYLNIMSPVKQFKGTKDWASQADVIWEIKELAEERVMGVWAPAQIIDSAYDKELYSLTDVKYGRALSETSPIVVGLIQTEKDELMGRMKLQTIKMRESGEFDPIVLRPDLKHMRLNRPMTVGRKSLLEHDNEVATISKDSIRREEREKQETSKRGGKRK